MNQVFIPVISKKEKKAKNTRELLQARMLSDGGDSHACTLHRMGWRHFGGDAASPHILSIRLLSLIGIEARSQPSCAQLEPAFLFGRNTPA